MVTTFGNKHKHHISIGGRVHGPFSNKTELVACAHENNVFLHNMEHHAVNMRVDGTYYLVWAEKE